MSRLTAAAAAIAASGAIAVGFVGNAAGAASPEADFGRHVATCAQEHLGQRDGAPAVTCTHDGVEMSFPNFGAMVQHMQEMHGG